MTSLVCPLLLAAALLTVAEAWCQNANWWRSFDHSGVSACPHDRTFITGFYRSARRSWRRDPIYLLEEAECCSPPAPWPNFKTQTRTADWWLAFDREAWVHCPHGYFLQGLFRSEWASHVHNIEEARCSKPADHPNHYGHCYNADIQKSFDNKGWSKCHPGYYVTGLYRSRCDELYCIEYLRCCSMATKPEDLDELAKVKTRVMDTTMADIARLGYYLGYGCKAQFVGEDFSRNGDTWQQIVDANGPCDNTGSNLDSSVRYGHFGYVVMHAKYGSGYRKYISGHPMSINYGHWGFKLKDIKYDNPVVTELPPEVIETGTVYNNYGRAITKQLSRCVTSARSVTHVQLNPWRNYRELNFQIPYTPTSKESSYGFSYVTSSTTTDQSQSTQTNTFTQTFYKTLHPYSAAKWNLLLSKTRTSVTYTATIEIRFSAELQGFLRWGEGGWRTNYHNKFYSSRARPVFHYRFGNQNTDFQTALRSESNSNALPWRWHAMRHAYKSAQPLINDLTDGRRYEFKISGRFDDVVGTKVDLAWVGVPLGKRSEQSLEGREAGDFEAVKNIYHVARDLSFDLRNATPSTRGDPQAEGIVHKLVSDQRAIGAGQMLVNRSLPTQGQLDGLSENKDRSLDIQETYNQVRSLDMQETQNQDRSLDTQGTLNQDRSLDIQETQNQDRSLDIQETQNQDRSLDMQETQNQDRSLDMQEIQNEDRSLDMQETQNQDRSLGIQETQNQERSLDMQEIQHQDRSLDMQETQNQERSLDTQETQNQDRSLDTQETQNQDRSLDMQETQNQDRSLDTQETQNQDRSLDMQETQNQDRSLDTQETQNQDRSLNMQEIQNQDRSLGIQETQNQERSLDMQEIQNQDRSLDMQETQNQERSLDMQETQNQDRSLDTQETQNQDRSLDMQETQNQDRSLDMQEIQNQDRSLDMQETLYSQ